MNKKLETKDASGHEMSMEDASGHKVSMEDVETALKTVRRTIVRDIIQVPPSLAVELPNIGRCLEALLNVMKKTPQ